MYNFKHTYLTKYNYDFKLSIIQLCIILNMRSIKYNYDFKQMTLGCYNRRLQSKQMHKVLQSGKVNSLIIEKFILNWVLND